MRDGSIVPDLPRLLTIGLCVSMCLIFLTWGLLHEMLRRDPELHVSYNRRVWMETIVMAVWEGSWIIRLTGMDRGIFSADACLRAGAYILFGGLLTALCIMDEQTMQIYDIFIWAGMISGGAMLFLKEGGFGSALPGLILYAGLQYGIFTRLYGRGDGHAFLLCALWIALGGGGIYECLLHMGASFGLLTVAQAGRRNIGRNGNLREPVPFLPYICSTVWFFL